MENIQIIYLVSFLGGMIALITPIIKLNTNITKLTSAVEVLTKRTDEDRCKQEKTIERVEDHETRIQIIERK